MRWRFVMPAGPSRVVLVFANFSIRERRILCWTRGSSIATVNSVDDEGAGTSLSRLKSAIARATASYRDSACTRASWTIPFESVNETAQRAVGIHEL